MNKKMLTSTLSAMVLSGLITGTALAAQNPFSDVPEDSWAYDAVSQLAADGIIDGYPDGTYKGQNTMTRYEMAQITARAMAKTDLDKADKALVDKLAAEFAEELDNLGVRVSDLEKKSDNVKWSGTVRYRYTDVDKTKPSGNSEHNLLFRIEPHAYIGNTGWRAHSRVEYLSDIGNDENFDATVDRAWVEGPALGGTWKLGKYPILSMNGLLLDDKVSGAEVIFNNDNLKTTIQAGRFNTDRSAANPDMDKTTADYYAVQFDYAQDTWTGQAGYYLFKDYFKEKTINLGDKTLSSADFDTDELSLWNVGLGYKFDDNFKIAGNYAENTKGEGYNTTGDFTVQGDESKAYSVELTYKGYDTKDPGSWDAFVAYRYLGAMVAIGPVYKGAWTDQKGIEFGVEFVPAENVLATLKYFDGKDISTDQDASKFFGQLELQF